MVGKGGILGDQGSCLFCSGTEQIAIIAKLCQAEADAAALPESSIASVSKEIAGASHLQISLGNGIAVVAGTHDLQAAGGVFRIAIGIGNENTVGFTVASAHSSSELVKLRETEALCVLNNHKRSIGYVYADLYYGSGNENVTFTRCEF